MKILMLGFSKLAYMPYIHFYLEQFAAKKNDIKLVYWNRDEKEEINLPYDIQMHEFKLYQEDDISKISKIGNLIKYRNEIKRLLFKEKFDLIVVLSTIPGILLFNTLKGDYKNQYIFDYRDVTYEKVWFYKKYVQELVKNSIITFVSSDAFRSNLPDIDKICTTHNILMESIPKKSFIGGRVRYCCEPIRIRYWGFIRHERINKSIIDALANDSRFELHYHGREQTTAINLKDYCRQRKINNIFFHGEYLPKDRYNFIKETDLLHNLFENNNMKLAMANKFYDGVIFQIPQLCNVGSFMGVQVDNNKIGFASDPFSKSFADDVFNYYRSIDWNTFEHNCDKLLGEIRLEYQRGSDVLKKLQNTLAQNAYKGKIHFENC